MTIGKLEGDLKILKFTLIFITIIQIAYFIIIFSSSKLWYELDFKFKANYVIAITHYLTLLVFLWYNWKKLPIQKKKKIDNTILMIFLGIIGMWLWLPNKEQINKFNLSKDFNIMQNIKIEENEKYKNSNKYKHIKNGIYLDLDDNNLTKYRLTISYELSNEVEGNNNQYPLEEILDKYLIHISDFLESENQNNSSRYKYELGGELENLKNALEIIGKRIFNREYEDKNGKTQLSLIIE